MANEIIWSYCSSCDRETKNTILFKKSKVERLDNQFDDYEIGSETFKVLECNGCENLSFRKDYQDFTISEFDEFGNEINQIEIKSSPSVLENNTPILHTNHLPEKISDIYEQTILAIKGGSKLLAGVGYRAVIEAICNQENIKGQSLEQKINNLSKNRLITEKEAERLHSIRFLGNDSVHEMQIASDNKLMLVLNIIEHLLNNLYIIDKKLKYVLDTIVKDYNGFEELLQECLGSCNVGEEKTLKEILGKHIRRIYTDISLLEQKLIQRINNSEITCLEPKSNDDSQVYIIKETLFLPF